MNRLLRCAGSLAVAPLLAGVTLPAIAAAQETADQATPPNIVVVMIDDANPHDGRLWSADYMPNLNELIVDRGDPLHRLPW